MLFIVEARSELTSFLVSVTMLYQLPRVPCSVAGFLPLPQGQSKATFAKRKASSWFLSTQLLKEAHLVDRGGGGPREDLEKEKWKLKKQSILFALPWSRDKALPGTSAGHLKWVRNLSRKSGRAALQTWVFLFVFLAPCYDEYSKALQSPFLSVRCLWPGHELHQTSRRWGRQRAQGLRACLELRIVSLCLLFDPLLEHANWQ